MLKRSVSSSIPCTPSLANQVTKCERNAGLNTIFWSNLVCQELGLVLVSLSSVAQTPNLKSWCKNELQPL